MRRSNGFTLIEVLITIAIVAILSAVAIPGYSQYIKRSRITEGLSGLSTMRIKMEQYFQDNRTYAGACATGSIAAPVSGTYFDITCVGTPDATTYTVKATGKTPMNGFVYTLDQSNTQSTVTVGSGWSGAGAACWVIKPDGSC